MTKKAKKAVNNIFEKRGMIIPIPGPTETSIGPFEVDEKDREGLRREHKKDAPLHYSIGSGLGGFVGGLAGFAKGDTMDWDALRAARANRSARSALDIPLGSKYKKILAPIGALAGGGLGAAVTKLLRDHKSRKIEKAKSMRATASAYGRNRARRKLKKRLDRAAKTKEKEGVPRLKGFKPQ